MSEQIPSRLEPGLYLVATPIGNARDITLRALDVLGAADVLVAEDTRVLRKLMAIHGVPIKDRHIMAYHDHSSEAVRRRILQAVADGQAVAYASDAGTPMVADPGFVLVRDGLEQGLLVTSVPGPSAALAALSIAGLATDRFLFAGFVPSTKGSRRALFVELGSVPATLIVFDTPRRCLANLKEAAAILGEGRRFAVCREVTKRFEEVRRGTLGEVEDVLDDMPIKGECVVVIERGTPQSGEADLDTALSDALRDMSVKDAAAQVSADLGIPRRAVYQRALELARDA